MVAKCRLRARLFTARPRGDPRGLPVRRARRSRRSPSTPSARSCPLLPRRSPLRFLRARQPLGFCFPSRFLRENLARTSYRSYCCVLEAEAGFGGRAAPSSELHAGAVGIADRELGDFVTRDNCVMIPEREDVRLACADRSRGATITQPAAAASALAGDQLLPSNSSGNNRPESTETAQTAWRRYRCYVEAMEARGRGYDQRLVLEAMFRGSDLAYAAPLR